MTYRAHCLLILPLCRAAPEDLELLACPGWGTACLLVAAYFTYSGSPFLPKKNRPPRRLCRMNIPTKSAPLALAFTDSFKDFHTAKDFLMQPCNSVLFFASSSMLSPVSPMFLSVCIFVSMSTRSISSSVSTSVISSAVCLLTILSATV